jgi:hypothetical protein
MESWLNFLKYFGLIIASYSSFIGIVGDFKEEDGHGNKKVTNAGKLAISLTAIGLVISALSSFLQDRKDEQKATDQVNYLIKQTLVDNYLQTTPENVELIIEMPYNIKQAEALIDSCELSFSWSSNYKNRTKSVNNFDFKGIVRVAKKELWFFIQKCNLGAGDSQLLPKTILKDYNDVVYFSDTTLNTIYERLSKKTHHIDFKSIELNQKDKSITDLTVSLIEYEYVNPPWDKLIDFRNNNFSFEIKMKNDIVISDSAKRSIGYLEFDDRYLLKLSHYDRFGERIDNQFTLWKLFRDDIASKISQ